MVLKDQLKKFLPRELIDRIQRIRADVDVILASTASRWGWSAKLYYAFYRHDFDREMRSVLSARRRYHRATAGIQPSSYLLRRNIHRLEKGLIMEPRRAVFGDGYIGETVEYYILCRATDALIPTEYSWAEDVLANYFSIVKTTPRIELARKLFESSSRSELSGSEGPACVPFRYSSLGPSQVNYDDFKALCERRHSVRRFDHQPVPGALLDAAIAVAATAPSACNRQPYKFYIFDDPEMARTVGSIPMGTAGFANNFQSLIVVVGDLSAYPMEKDRHIIYIDSALAVMQLQLALETLGLSSCTINWPDIERHERQMAELLQLADYQRPTMLVAVGYANADALVPYSAKKTVDDLAVRPK